MFKPQSAVSDRKPTGLEVRRLNSKSGSVTNCVRSQESGCPWGRNDRKELEGVLVILNFLI